MEWPQRIKWWHRIDGWHRWKFENLWIETEIIIECMLNLVENAQWIKHVHVHIEAEQIVEWGLSEWWWSPLPWINFFFVVVVVTMWWMDLCKWYSVSRVVVLVVLELNLYKFIWTVVFYAGMFYFMKSLLWLPFVLLTVSFCGRLLLNTHAIICNRIALRSDIVYRKLLYRKLLLN